MPDSQSLSRIAYLTSRKIEATELFTTLLTASELTPEDLNWAGKADLGYVVVKWTPGMYSLEVSRPATPTPPEYFHDLTSVMETILRKWW